MSKGLIAGSFDPPTLGHLDVIERSAALCDTLLVGIARNNEKKETFSMDERVELLKTMTKGRKNIEVVVIDGLVVTFAKQNGVAFLIRGLRPFGDEEHEFQMALANKKIGNIETFFLMADGKYAHISSSLIREIAKQQHHLKDFIPESIEAQVSDRLRG